MLQALTPYLDKLGFSLVGFGCTTSSELRAASGRGRGRRYRERPRRGRRPVGEPQLRGADPSAGSSELPRVAAARGRLRPRRSRRGRPLEPAAWATADGTEVYLRDLWPSSDEVRAAIAASVSAEQFEREYGGSSTGTSVGARCPRPRVRCTRGIRARPTCRSHPSSRSSPGARRTRRTSSAHAASSRLGLHHDRSHLAGGIHQTGVTGGSVPDRAGRRAARLQLLRGSGAGTTR